ncbi:MAG: NADP-dependent isocitrate dehydrogenase [Deltaproteobacteria bacterium]|nr:MAG: NADP-dependent isocitrate dehydrogenase [Deltaproteobacteria bacterium]
MIAQRNKIKVKTPIVEMDGDEMTRIMWGMVKEKLILPHVEMDLVYYDLHIKNRDKTRDQVTVNAANAIIKHGVGVKCATITPNADRVKEYNLREMWKSPNGTIRSMLDGTVFRKPILAKNIKPFVSTWKEPIVIGRHAHGDVYSNAELGIPGPGKAEIVFTPSQGGKPAKQTIKEFDGPGIIQGIYNTDESIRNFASTCFSFAFDQKLDLWFSTKDTISKTYDARFRDIFEEEYQGNWVAKFRDVGIEYFFTLIDDAVARIIRSKGGILWALKNYDGDVMSDLVASACGSLAMMTSVLVSPSGCFEYEAAHGTVQKHYYKHLNKEETSTNSMALIFAWSGGLRRRGKLDGTEEVVGFANELEEAAIETIESGVMTGDLLFVAEKSPNNRRVNTQEFIDAVAERLQRKLQG